MIEGLIKKKVMVSPTNKKTPDLIFPPSKKQKGNATKRSTPKS